MKSWMRIVLPCLLIAAPVAARADGVPLDGTGFTNYIQQKLQLYSPSPVTVVSPFHVSVVRVGNDVSVLNFQSLHDDCARKPADCESLSHAYVQQVARDLRPTPVAPRSPPTEQTFPSDPDKFMSFVAAELAKRLPNDKIEVSGFRLDVTRPSGHAIPFDGREGYALCAAQRFQCQAALSAFLERMSNWLTMPDPARLRVALHIMASCDVVASVGNSVSCHVTPTKEPMGVFFRRAFANLEEICFKIAPDGTELPMTNADRHDLDMDIGAALDRCDASAHDAMGPLRLDPLAERSFGPRFV